MSEKFRNRVREIRETRGWSQTRLAAAAGVGVSVLNRIELWHFPVSERWAKRVAEALGRETSELFPYLREGQPR
jgi:ribosome-binding protein aMBF1 (putative translation factor)